MFDSLSEKLNNAFRRFRGKGKLTEADVREGMREVRMALLEADVNYKVTRDFIKTVTERAVGSEVMESLLPGQQIVKIVHEELIRLMGETNNKLVISPKPPTVVMMVGLQGTGKTTHAAKLAGMYRKQGKRPLLVACDVYRPAAIDQLKVVGAQVEVPVFDMGKEDPVKIAKAGLEHAARHGHDMVFIDTAGRLQVDDVLMQELENIKAETNPTEILLVVDAMTGQAAVDVATVFNERLDITGVVLSKMDGDTRGGAALATRYVTGKPIKFVGVGEKMDAIEPFYPDRIASRILGMGDVLTLIEKAQQTIDDKKAAELEKKLRENNFTLNDYLEQFRQIKNMGSLDQLVGMIPGMKPGALKDAKIDEKALARTEAIILSMTAYERDHPDVINGSRRRRIAAGSGTSVEEVNRLMKQYDQMNKMIKQFSGQFGGKRGKKKMKIPFSLG
ncbi:MAG: signal recognition particle protein [Clostridia bacterium]|nr:signal recognition particle protein [Clostridia bacterium]MBQ3956387.1 signal recognition particle protein [Clostridia bacterium]